MATPMVLEGTWEEIKLHEKELAGRKVTVVVAPIEEPVQTATPDEAIPVKLLQGYGAFKGKGGGTEALMREKQADIEREELKWK